MQKNLALYLLVLTASLIFSCTKNNQLDSTLNLVMQENPKNLDPALSQDALAAEAINNTYETLYQYNYLKRPYVLEPSLAASMPEFSKDGLTVTIPIKQGVRFQDDPCFENGKGRELVAEDFIFEIKRIADPKVTSEGWFLFNGKFVGLDEWRKKSIDSGSTDYKTEIKGLKAKDKYTLVITLTQKYPQLMYALAMVYTAPMAFEAIQKYGPEIANHTVGTGPFVIKEYVRNSHILYVKNPNFRSETFPLDKIPASRVACDNPIEKLDTQCTSGEAFADLDYGKPLPLVDSIRLHIIRESQPRWLKFMKGELDLSRIPKDNFTQAIVNGKLSPELSKMGVQLSINESTTQWWLGFNMKDSFLGKNPKVRRAIGYAFDSQKDLELFTNNRGKLANQILPPNIEGFVSSIEPRQVDLNKAAKLLEEAGFKNGKGIPTIIYDTESDSVERQRGEFVQGLMKKIGINIQVRLNTRPELLERKRKGDFQLVMDGWVADYPDAENFMQLLYGPNHGPGPNSSFFDNAEYNQLYKKMASMVPSQERTKIIERMTRIMLADAPWIPNWYATLYYVTQSRMRNYVYSDFAYNNYKYYGLRKGE